MPAAHESLRVGVPPCLLELAPQTSAGRLWSHVLPGLADLGLHLEVANPHRRWRSARVDVWLTDGHRGPLRLNAPVVAHLQGAPRVDPAVQTPFEPERPADADASEAAAAEARRVITVSESSKAEIVRAYERAPEEVDVVHGGVDQTVYRPGLPNPGFLIAARGGEPQRPYVLFVAELHPRKNLGALREAMAGLAARGFTHALVLVARPASDRADAEALDAEATSPIRGVATPVVNLAGASDAEVARLMAGAAAFCLPSLGGGSGLAVAEAMACGAPVVVSDRGGLPELVGSAGLVVPPTAEAIEGALVQVFSTPAAATTLRALAHERAAAFRWEATAAGFRAALEAAV